VKRVCQGGRKVAAHTWLKVGAESPMVRLVLRDKVYEVKPGMTLLSALQKAQILPETVIAAREGELILEDEILRDNEEIKLLEVISGGA
jgi:sulfur carrier protein ThiS